MIFQIWVVFAGQVARIGVPVWPVKGKGPQRRPNVENCIGGKQQNSKNCFLNFVRLINYCVKPLFIVQYIHQDFSAAQFYAQGWNR